MAVELTRCPKCSHQQEAAPECSECGLIFSRYKKAQERLQKEQSARAEAGEKQRKRIWSILQTVVLVLLTAGGTYYFTKTDSTPDTQSLEPPVVTNMVVEKATEAIGEPVDVQEKKTVPQTVNHQIARPMTIDEARRATVSIETPWGSGSGFFLSENFIVTNRHVVKMEEEQLVEFRRKVETTRELVDLEQKKIRDLRKRKNRTPVGPTRTQMEIIIQEGERGLREIMPQLEEAEKRLAQLEGKINPGDIKIILADGTSYTASYLLLSDKHDLALMSLFVNDVRYLHRPPQKYQIRQGDKVFTIGSPVGLRNTVTSGVFSGYRKDKQDGSLFLQTDAPINPGNSGGPLIDENGYVHGVNTMILQGTEGIGFAIPIDTVFEEFGSAIY